MSIVKLQLSLFFKQVLYLHCNMFCILGLVLRRPYGMKFCVEVWHHFIQYCKGYYTKHDVNKPCTIEGLQQSIKKCEKNSETLEK